MNDVIKLRFRRPKIAMFALLAMTAGLVGCPTMPSHLASGPRPLVLDGDYLHEPSGLLFPWRYGDFQRVAGTQYDGEGENISVGYDKGQAIALTIYVYPGPWLASPGTDPEVLAALQAALMENHFKESVERIAAFHPGATILEHGPIRLNRGGTEIDAYKGTFRLGGSNSSISQAYFWAGERGWVVKYRVTTKQLSPAELEEQIGDLMAELPLNEGE